MIRNEAFDVLDFINSQSIAQHYWGVVQDFMISAFHSVEYLERNPHLEGKIIEGSYVYLYTDCLSWKEQQELPAPSEVLYAMEKSAISVKVLFWEM